MDAPASLFTQGLTLGFSAAAMLGPFQAFLFSQASRTGVRRTLPLTLAPLATDPPIVALVLVALTRVPEGFLRALEVAGGAFLLWLARGAWQARTRARGDERAGAVPGGDGGAHPFLRAVLVNASGPGPWIFWSTVCGPILASAWRGGPLRALAFLAGFYAMLVGGKAALTAAFGLAGRVGPRTAHALGLASALLMAGMGGLQLWRGLAGG